jgi:hypothetical protein
MKIYSSNPMPDPINFSMLELIDSTWIIIMTNIKEELNRIRVGDGKQRRGDGK